MSALGKSAALLVAVSVVACGSREEPVSHPQPQSQAPGATASWQEPGPPVPAPNPPAVEPRGSEPQESQLAAPLQEMLDTHNRHRAKHCAADLRWSPTLAKVAQAWADTLAKRGCAFEHSQNSPYGENLSFSAPVGSLPPSRVADSWYREVDKYSFARAAFDFQTGHFTQLVWKGTTELGCGRSECRGGEIWVCNYDPPGNMMGSFRQNVLPAQCQ